MREEDTVVSARLDEGDAAVMMENLHDGKLTIGHLSRELVQSHRYPGRLDSGRGIETAEVEKEPVEKG